MNPTVRLNHFLRGPVEVQPEIVNGRREWTCPNRPMMRPWEDCHFKESSTEIDAVLVKASEGVGNNGGPRPTADASVSR